MKLLNNQYMNNHTLSDDPGPIIQEVPQPRLRMTYGITRSTDTPLFRVDGDLEDNERAPADT